MSQPWWTIDITDNEDVLFTRLVALVHLHVTTLIELGVTSSRKNRSDSNRHETSLCGQLLSPLLIPHSQSHAVAIILELSDLRIGQAVYSELLVRFLQRLADFAIFNGKNRWLHLDESDLCAEGLVDVGKFHSDRSGTDDQHRLGLLLKSHCMLRRKHGLAIKR